jgi:hypothetical protein
MQNSQHGRAAAQSRNRALADELSVFGVAADADSFLPAQSSKDGDLRFSNYRKIDEIRR